MFARVRERKEKHIAAERLSAYLDGQVTAQERIQVQQHLGACAACAHELDTLRYTIDLLRATPRLSVPRAFTLSEADVGRATVRRQMPRLALYLQGATALVAALLLVVIVGDVVRKPVRYAAPQQVVMERAVRETVVVEAAQEAGLEIREEAAVAEKEVEVEKPLEVQKAVAVTVEVEREAVMERPAAAPATAAAAIAEAEGEPDAEVPAELPMRAMAVVTEETPPPPLEAQPKADVQALAAEPTIEALMAQETVEEAAPAAAEPAPPPAPEAAPPETEVSLAAAPTAAPVPTPELQATPPVSREVAARPAARWSLARLAEIVLVILLVILLGLTLWLRRRR